MARQAPFPKLSMTLRSLMTKQQQKCVHYLCTLPENIYHRLKNNRVNMKMQCNSASARAGHNQHTLEPF